LPPPPAARLSQVPIRSRARLVGLARGDRLGAVFLAALVWLLFEFGRPYTPPGLPLALTGIIFLDWVLKKEKQLGPRWIWWLVVIGVIAAGVPLAENTFDAYFYTRQMGILFVGICLPLQALLTSVRRLRWWLNAFILISFYVGIWAATHSGYGPAGAAGQDENYVAALMTMGAAMAYFSFFTEKRSWVRVVLALAMCSYLAAIALAENPSRGGFLALVAVGLYCLWRSPRKGMGLTVVGTASVVLLLAAGDSFWKEIDTTTDYKSGTGDMRLELWKAGVRMWESNPVLGVGAGNFRWVVGEYESARQFEKFGRDLGGSVIAHSSHVEMLAELGAAGTLAMVVLTWSTWQGLGRIRPPNGKKGKPPVHPDLIQLGHYADAIRCAILAVLVNGTFLSLFYYSHLWVLIAVGTAMPYVHRRILEREAVMAADAPSSVGVANNDLVSAAANDRGRRWMPRRTT
jgi:O-antigen ligase